MKSQLTTFVSEQRDPTGTLVVIFLRGGADGLNMIIPHGDARYYAARPSIGIRRSDLVDLDGFFGLNSHLKPLHSWWRTGELSLVHCAGSEDESRSHFEAQDFMEHGGLAAGGWLARFLRARPDAGQSPLTAVAIGTTLPECLRGAPSCAAIQTLEDFGPGMPPAFLVSLARLYKTAPRELGTAGQNALAAVARIQALTVTSYSPSGGALYPSDPFASGLNQVARLIKGRVGLQAATLDLGGWDSHITQSVIMDPPMQRLAQGLQAFATDLGPAELARTQIVVMTEFGRRVAENSASGTDHGRGGVMFLLGGGVSGGKVHVEWPDLATQLAGPGDLPVLNNYRGLAKQMVMGKLRDDAVRAKDYLYALRSVLAAKWISESHSIPPVPFADLITTAPPSIQALIPKLLEHKARTAESERMERLPDLDAFLHEFLNSTTTLPHGSGNLTSLDCLLRSEIRRPIEHLQPVEFTLDRIRQPDLLLMDTIAGSHAYGTAIEGSDEDRRGVFVAPSPFIAGLDAIELVADERSDQVYYELGHFVSLLLKNNPKALELLAMPEDCIRHKDPLFERLKPGIFLSKLCAKTFGEYAMGQIRKARGLNKKIVNPQPEKRLSLLDFCHVPHGQGSVPVLEWLADRNLDPRKCGLTSVQHAAGMFAIYHDPAAGYRGLISPKDPDSLIFTSVPKEAEPSGWMQFNSDAFRAHCKAHREYWEWVGQRNEERYATNAQHGRGYDSKNLLHTLRLLDMAGEIAREGVLRVRRPNREYLLRVRSSEFAYEDLVARAEAQLSEVIAAFETSDLQDEPDRRRVNRLLFEIREAF